MEMILLILLAALYALSMVLGLLKRRRASMILVYAAFAVHLGLLIFRSIMAKHPPFTNVYESLMLLSWLMQVKFLFFQKSSSVMLAALQKAVVLAFIAVLILLPPATREIRPVMPALNNIWMYIHVPSYLFSYVALFSALIVSLIRTFSKRNLTQFDEQMDIDVSLAMLFMSVGLITGAIWGQISWGNFWSWDPKETWALINMVVLSLYFHTKDKKTQALIVIIAALTVLFTYFGVTWLLSGLHSYS